MKNVQVLEKNGGDNFDWAHTTEVFSMESLAKLECYDYTDESRCSLPTSIPQNAEGHFHLR